VNRKLGWGLAYTGSGVTVVSMKLVQSAMRVTRLGSLSRVPVTALAQLSALQAARVVATRERMTRTAFIVMGC
jgi:hypothetical protein